MKLSIALAGMPTAETINFIRAKTDNDGDGTYETTIFNFSGSNNSAYADTTLGALTSAFQTFSNLVLPTPTAPDGMLRLRFETFNDTDSANEATGFDSILISGTPLSLTVSITSPTPDQAFLPGASISATATVASGTPSYTVNFYTNYNGGAYGPAGTASTSPYTIDLGILAEGTYTIYSTVTDSASPTPGTDTSVTNTFTVDGTLPTLAATGIVDNQSGGPVQEDTTLVTYTVTFSEDMDASTVSANDFGNTGDATFTIGSVTETAPGVFSVPVTPTSVGTLQLQVNAGAELKDLAGNALVTTLAIVDDTPITVTADTTAPTPDPLTWATAPKASGASSIVMTATTATDGSGVEYFFECTAGGGHSSNWQNSATYTDTGLLPNAAYTYRVQARDKSTAQNATGFSATASATTLLGITGSHGGDQYAPNGLNSLLNGSGMTRPNLADPSTWTVNYGSYPDEWMGDFLIGASNSKLAWVAFDLGSSSALEKLYLWNIRYQGGIAGTATYNLYYADSPTVALPSRPNPSAYSVTGLTPQGDYDFSGGGWTKFNTTGTLSAPKAGNSIVDLSGVSARYIALEILTNWGDTYLGGRVGFLETAFTRTVTPTAGYAAWQATNGATGTINEDHDNDGVPNGIEYFLGGNTNTTGFTALPGVSNSGGALSVTWTKDAGYTGTYGTDFVVETSETLTGDWQIETLGGGQVTDDPGYVTYTFPSPLGSKKFARLKVTGP